MNVENREALSLLDSFRFVWSTRYDVLIGMGLAAVLASMYILFVTPKYRADITLVPPSVATTPSSGLSGGSELAGMASLVGLKTGGDNVSAYARFQLLVTSESVARVLVKDPYVMQQIFHAKWDVGQQRWVAPASPFGFLRRSMMWLIGRSPGDTVDANDLASYLETNIQIKPLETQGIIQLSYWNRNQKFAFYLVTRLQKTADDILRGSDRTRFMDYQRYLQDQIEKASTGELRTNLGQVLGGITQRVMTMSSSLPYAADILDGPIVSSRPVTPPVGLTYLVFVLLGAFAGLLAAVARKTGYRPRLWERNRIHAL